MVRSGNYDVVLMDMQMPVIDGLAPRAALRAQGMKTPIVALTANAMQGIEKPRYSRPGSMST